MHKAWIVEMVTVEGENEFAAFAGESEAMEFYWFIRVGMMFLDGLRKVSKPRYADIGMSIEEWNNMQVATTNADNFPTIH